MASPTYANKDQQNTFLNTVLFAKGTEITDEFKKFLSSNTVTFSQAKNTEAVQSLMFYNIAWINDRLALNDRPAYMDFVKTLYNKLGAKPALLTLSSIAEKIAGWNPDASVIKFGPIMDKVNDGTFYAVRNVSVEKGEITWLNFTNADGDMPLKDVLGSSFKKDAGPSPAPAPKTKKEIPSPTTSKDTKGSSEKNSKESAKSNKDILQSTVTFFPLDHVSKDMKTYLQTTLKSYYSDSDASLFRNSWLNERLRDVLNYAGSMGWVDPNWEQTMNNQGKHQNLALTPNQEALIKAMMVVYVRGGKAAGDETFNALQRDIDPNAKLSGSDVLKAAYDISTSAKVKSQLAQTMKSVKVYGFTMSKTAFMERVFKDIMKGVKIEPASDAGSINLDKTVQPDNANQPDIKAQNKSADISATVDSAKLVQDYLSANYPGIYFAAYDAAKSAQFVDGKGGIIESALDTEVLANYKVCIKEQTLVSSEMFDKVASIPGITITPESGMTENGYYSIEALLGNAGRQIAELDSKYAAQEIAANNILSGKYDIKPLDMVNGKSKIKQGQIAKDLETLGFTKTALPEELEKRTLQKAQIARELNIISKNGSKPDSNWILKPYFESQAKNFAANQELKDAKAALEALGGKVIALHTLPDINASLKAKKDKAPRKAKEPRPIQVEKPKKEKVPKPEHAPKQEKIKEKKRVKVKKEKIKDAPIPAEKPKQEIKSNASATAFADANAAWDALTNGKSFAKADGTALTQDELDALKTDFENRFPGLLGDRDSASLKEAQNMFNDLLKKIVPPEVQNADKTRTFGSDEIEAE